MTRANSHRRGYVLLMTLLLLVVAAISMVALSRRSLQQAVEASRAQEELQHRWGVVTARSAFLPIVENALTAAEKKTGTSAQMVPVRLNLGTQKFTLLMGDEQAKVNVNALYTRRGKRELETSLRNLVRASRSSVSSALRLRLPSTVVTKTPHIESFGQLFDAPDAQTLCTDDYPTESVGSFVTSWGSGVLNFKRASKEALAEATAPLLTRYEAERLIQIRQKNLDISPQQALATLGVQREKQEQLSKLLGTKSDCYSIWVISDNGSHKSYHFFVRWVQPQKEETFSFSW